jgi:hypothetical protein
MKYIVKSRGLGKTYDLIDLCHAQNGILIVPTEANKNYIFNMAYNDLGIPPENLTVISCNEIYKLKGNDLNRPIFMDECLICLEKLLGKNINTVSFTL